MQSDDRTYSISELAREFSCTPRALRFYEDKGLLSPRRVGVMRVYSARDRARLTLILRGKRVGLSLLDIKEILDLYGADSDNRAQSKVALKKFRERLQALESQRGDLEAAIEMVRDGIVRMEQELGEAAPPVLAAPAAKAKPRRSPLAERKALQETH